MNRCSPGGDETRRRRLVWSGLVLEWTGLVVVFVEKEGPVAACQWQAGQWSRRGGALDWSTGAHWSLFLGSSPPSRGD